MANMTSVSRLFLVGYRNTGCLCRTLRASVVNKTPSSSVGLYSYRLIHSSSKKYASTVQTSSIWTTSSSTSEVQAKEEFSCSVDVSDDGDFLKVTWEDGRLGCYPYVWLRDNCQCSDCFNIDMNQRLFSYRTFNADVKLVDIDVSANGIIVLHGTDGHETNLDLSWLREKGEEMLKGKSDVDFEKVYWGSNVGSIVPSFNYDDVMEDALTMYEWMKSIKTFGIGRIKGAPKKSNELMNIANKIAHVRTTLFGDISIIKARSDAFFIGYTPIELPLHTDYTFGKTVPGVLLLHSIERPESGGENWFADGFKAAYDLRELDENAFNILCRGILEFEIDGESRGQDVHLKGRCPTITLNTAGEVEKVSFSDHTRTPNIKNISTKEIPEFYRALKKFASLLYSPENLLVLPLEEGEMLATDNFRVVHGRAGFKLSKNRGRHVEHIFFDIEDFDSRMRCIANKI